MVANPPSSLNYNISISKNNSLQANQHRHFYPLEVSSMHHLAEVMAAKVWSPIVWKDGLRLKENFLSSAFLALDFDDGTLTLEKAKNLAKGTGFGFIIGTSKSHQKEKVTASGVVQKACDRFRLVYRMAEETKLREVYRYNMIELMDIYPCDTSCKDEARFFYGCKDIIHVEEGEGIPWKEVEAKENFSNDDLVSYQHEKYAYYRDNKLLPLWAQNALAHGFSPGGRHKMCYRLGATLIHIGYSEKQIIQMCMKSFKDIGTEDIERAVANGAERSRREYEKAQGCADQKEAKKA